MDLKNILEEDNSKNNPNVKVYKKPIQLKDIERRSKTNLSKTNDNIDINSYIDKEKENIFNQLWTKLNNGSKLNRLNIFIDELKIKYELSDKEKDDLTLLLCDACNKNKLNKVSYIIYNKDEARITDIKILKFDNKNRKFILNYEKVKNKPKSKSKSNIEKLLK